MNTEHLQNLSEVESEFMQEGQGSGSLATYAVRDTANFSKDAARDEGFYIGYDIHPENIEALYFEGLQLPRWESIKAESIAEKTEIYQKSFQKSIADYPLISRVSDTDVKVIYAPEEVSQLREECGRVLDNTNDAKAVVALQKFYIACNKAVENQMGLLLIPS